MKLPDSIKKDFALFRSFHECKKTTKKHAKSFYFSSFLLPPEKRYAAFAIYDFCRFADDIMDKSTFNSTEKAAEINKLSGKLDMIYNYTLPADDRLYALKHTINKFDIPEKYFRDLLSGLMLDEGKVRFESFNQLRTYCYHVAGVVGLILTHVFGIKDKNALDYAESLGIAMQLTNILRDIKEDALSDRIYIPQEDLLKFNYTETDIKNSVINDNFNKLMKFQIDRAEKYYKNSLSGMPYLSNDGSRSTAMIMYKTYSSILRRIDRADYNVFSTRHYVSLPGKILIALGYFLKRKNKNISSDLSAEEALKKA